jgi:hypothetical protein
MVMSDTAPGLAESSANSRDHDPFEIQRPAAQALAVFFVEGSRKRRAVASSDS